ncbi:MAG: acetylglucosamine-6-sulfatase [Verrucomicrobia bacterium]|nr:acetylglucosamine-6-sulfatase [Verrucomicrobiota bacterium]
MENHIVMWMEKFGRQIQATRDMSDCELLFVGDSITEHWSLDEYGLRVWEKYYADRKAVNVGSGGDCTENILWRLENGIFEQIAPELVVLMAGTNNTGRRMDSPEEICAGVKAIVECIHFRSPASHILLHAIFPRGLDASDPLRKNNEQANVLIKAVAQSYSFVEFIDINTVFLGENSVLPETIMPDLLHPNEAGYGLWAAAIEDRVQAYLK